MLDAFAQKQASGPRCFRACARRLVCRSAISPRGVLSVSGLGDNGLDKTEQRLGEMERGELDATSVSPRIIEVLGTRPWHELRRPRANGHASGRPRRAVRCTGARRVSEVSTDGLDLLADALTTAAPEGEWDEVDELFFGRS